MPQLLTNLRLALATVLEHVGDDPVVLMLQISRRLPARIIRPGAEAVYRLSRKRPHSVPHLLAAFLTGRSAELTAVIKQAMHDGVNGTTSRRMADIAIATGNTSLAHELLEGVSPTVPGRAGTSARLLWHQGHMTQAVEALEGAGDAEGHQRERLASELRVFNGWAPTIPRGRIKPVKHRVLHVLTNSLPHTGSGYAQRSHSILAAQRDLGWDVKAVTRVGYPVQVGKLFARETDVVDGIQYQRLLPGKLAQGSEGRLQQQTEALAAIVRDFRPAVIHTTTHFVNGLVVREVAQKYGIPWVYEVRGQPADTWAATREEHARSSERYRMFQAREAEIMRSADLVVTLGETMRSAIVQKGVPMNKVLIAPNSVGEQYLAEPIDPTSAREQLGIPHRGPMIGTVTSLVDYEGLEVLLDAFAILAPRFADLKVLIVGDGVTGPALRSRARVSGLADRVIFTGRVRREKAALYHQALDIFVVPRRDLDVTRSVTPLKPVEAMASARPVVASDLPALREIVGHGKTGLLVRAESAAAFAEAIQELLENRDILRSYGAAGRRRALAERTWVSNAEKQASAYADLAVRR